MIARFEGSVEVRRKWACKHEEVIVDALIGGVSPLQMLCAYYHRGATAKVFMRLGDIAAEGHLTLEDGNSEHWTEEWEALRPPKASALRVGDYNLLAELVAQDGERVELLLGDEPIRTAPTLDFPARLGRVRQWAVRTEPCGPDGYRVFVEEVAGIHESGGYLLKEAGSQYLRRTDISVASDFYEDQGAAEAAQRTLIEGFVETAETQRATIERLVRDGHSVIFCDRGGAPFVGRIEAINGDALRVRSYWYWTPVAPPPNPMLIRTRGTERGEFHWPRLIEPEPTPEQLSSIEAAAKTRSEATKGKWPFWTWPDIEDAATKAGLRLFPISLHPIEAHRYAGNGSLAKRD